MNKKAASQSLFKKTAPILFGAIFLTLLLVNPQPTQAEIINPVIGELGNDAEAAASGNTFVNYMVMLWRTSISLGALAVLFYYLLGAFKWLTSQGDSGKVEEAKKIFTNATIGLILLVSSFTIVSFVSEMFFDGQFNILELTLPTPDGSTGGGRGNRDNDQRSQPAPQPEIERGFGER